MAKDSDDNVKAYALTVHQPWAWAITMGHKTIENRTWHTSYRGPLFIHAGGRKGAKEWLADWDTLVEEFAERGVKLPPIGTLTFGAIVAVAELTDVVPLRKAPRDDPFASGPW